MKTHFESCPSEDFPLEDFVSNDLDALSDWEIGMLPVWEVCERCCCMLREQICVSQFQLFLRNLISLFAEWIYVVSLQEEQVIDFGASFSRPCTNCPYFCSLFDCDWLHMPNNVNYNC
jgi:hypothetical protein